MNRSIQSRDGAALSKRELWWVRLINVEWDSRVSPFRSFIWVHPHTSVTERGGSMEPHAGSAGQGKSGVSWCLGADPAGITGYKSLQKALARPQWDLVAAATPLKPAQRHFHPQQAMCCPKSWKFYRASAQPCQQGSGAYTGRCRAESAARLMRASGGLTEMTKRSSKWNLLQASPGCRVWLKSLSYVRNKNKFFLGHFIVED